MRAAIPILFLLTPLAANAQEAPSFAKDVAPIFAANCAGCHAGTVKMGALSLDTFDSLMQGGHKGAVIVPGKSNDSRLYLMITGKMQPAMPLSGSKLADGEVEIIRKWIDAGAKPPAPGEQVISKGPEIPDIKPRSPVRAEIASLAYSPDGKILALGSFHEVRLIEPGSNKTIATLGGHAQEVRSVAFSPDGTLLAAAGGLPAREGEVKIWDVEKRAELRSWRGHKDCIYSVAFAPDGRSLATASYDKLIKIWDTASGKEIRTLKDHIDSIFALAFLPDGKRLVSAAADRTVKIWDVATGQRLYTLGDSQDGLNTVAVDPTGTKVAAAGQDKTIRIWSLAERSGSLVNSLIAHEDAVLQLAWSPDGKYLVSSGADRTIKIFNAVDLTEVKAYPNQPDWVLSLRFAPDGKSFAAGRFDGSVQIYNAADYEKSAVHVAQR